MHKLLMLDLIVWKELVAFIYDGSLQLSLEQYKGFGDSKEEFEHELDFIEFIVLDHVTEAWMLHIEESLSMVTYVLL